jgi:elongation factor 1 alpha-like protein
VAVNKLDLVDWSEQRFRDIVRLLLTFLKQNGFREKNIIFVPLSGYTGQNIVTLDEPKASNEI